MKVFDYYDEQEKTDYVWYDSTNLYHSVAVENGDGTINLKIVFSNGFTYLYYKVAMLDYLGMKQADSNGRAFDVLIAKKVDGKPKYEYRRVADSSLEEINKLMSDYKDLAFKLAEEKQSQVEDVEKNKKQPDTEQVQVAQPAQTSPVHKFNIAYDKVAQKAVAIVDGEEVSKFACATENDFARMALFLAPIVSNLGYPISINVGD